MPIQVVSWNIAKRSAPWRELAGMGADVALLQEAGDRPADAGGPVDDGPRESWDSHRWNSDSWSQGRFTRLYDRWAKVVKLSDAVEVEWFKQISPIGWDVKEDEIAVSGIGTIAAARVKPLSSEPFIVVSMYARWVGPHPTTKSKWKAGFVDGSAHRIISDLSAFVGDTDPASHRILTAGDLNFWHMDWGAVPRDFGARHKSVFDRMDALGLVLLGPQAPDGGRQADAPVGTRNVATFRGRNAASDTVGTQLDYVFASRGFHEQITVRAMNEPEEWGPSDHCRILIEIEDA